MRAVKPTRMVTLQGFSFSLTAYIVNTPGSVRKMCIRDRAGGLNLWDSAVVYGMGASESLLAAFTKEHNREDVLISTKFTPQIAGDSVNPVEDMLGSSLERFGTDYIDIYWIHNPADVERCV